MDKPLLFTCLLFVSLISCGSNKSLDTHDKQQYTNAVKGSKQDSLLRFGFKYLNTPYRYGGTSPRGFDCSGYTSYVFKQFGYHLNRTSRSQAKQFPSVKRKRLQPTDLVFFEGRAHNGRVGHVGIVTDVKPNGEFHFVHASTSKGVTVSSSKEVYWLSRYVKAGRVIEENPKRVVVKPLNKTKVMAQNKETSVETPVAERKLKEAIVYPNQQFHTVQRGESLLELSQKYDVPVSTLQYLNNLKSNRLKKGQKIKLRNDDANNQSAFMENQPETVEQEDDFSIPQTPNTHVVKRGETLFSIARKYGISLDELKKKNRISSNTLGIGQVLKLR